MTPELDLLELAWDIVWWRRLAYFATLVTTIFVGLFFAALVYEWPKDILASVENALTTLAGQHIEAALTLAIQKSGSAVASILPGWFAAVLPEISKYPLTAIVSLTLLATLFFVVSATLQRRIAAYAEWAWGDQKGLPAADAPAPNWLNVIARPGRKISGWLYRTLWLGFVVNAIGIILAVVALIVSSPYWIWRVIRRRPWMA